MQLKEIFPILLDPQGEQITGNQLTAMREHLMLAPFTLFFSLHQDFNMSTLTVHHTESENKGMAYVGDYLSPRAALTYTLAGKALLIIDHTEVEDSLRGQGVGRQMLDFVVNLARERGLQILPLCPYARAVFKKDESIHDVLRG